GWICQNGYDGPADAKAAFFHYQLAAQGGEPEGMYNLAHCYYQGIGTAQSTSAARQWLRKAVEAAGDNHQLRQEAQEALNNI
ncbi:MAG: sel1 repeat family protein, partial [Oscillospiraceae bacterium]|nr:sel1 repeat family protein [Oscillospiraceae bacterium]